MYEKDYVNMRRIRQLFEMYVIILISNSAYRLRSYLPYLYTMGDPWDPEMDCKPARAAHSDI